MATQKMESSNRMYENRGKGWWPVAPPLTDTKKQRHKPFGLKGMHKVNSGLLKYMAAKKTTASPNCDNRQHTVNPTNNPRKFNAW